MHFKISWRLITQKNKTIFYRSVFIIALQIFSFGYTVTAEEAAKIACEAAKDSALSQGLQAIAGVGAWIGLAVNVYKVGKDVKVHFHPSEEEQFHAQKINKQLELIELRKNLRTCLVENRMSTEKTSLGIPYQCEQAAFLLGIMGSQDEVNRMVVIINRFDEADKTATIANVFNE